MQLRRESSTRQMVACHSAPSHRYSSPRCCCIAPRNTQLKLPARHSHRNQQYSITALTDTTGTISERYAYDAYGKLTVLAGGGTVLSGSAYGNRYTYTGREWDGELGLYHYRARMYSPDTGRFVSRDPIGYVDGASLYTAYFSLSSVDPAGKKVVGITPEGYHIMKMADGTCRYSDEAAQATVVVDCPSLPKDDPEGPGYVEGLASIRDGLSLLETACDNCCAGECTPEKCKSEAKRIVNSLMQSWQNNYNHQPADGTGWPHSHRDCVAGQYCFTWSNIYKDAFDKALAGSVCFTGKRRHSVLLADVDKPRYIDGKRAYLVHWYFTVEVNNESGAKNCMVAFDDGFLVPRTCSHAGDCPIDDAYVPLPPGHPMGSVHPDHPFIPFDIGRKR